MRTKIMLFDAIEGVIEKTDFEGTMEYLESSMYNLQYQYCEGEMPTFRLFKSQDGNRKYLECYSNSDYSHIANIIPGSPIKES
jgi:hypothetical protein